MDDIKSDIKDIKNTTIELVKQGAVHNALLKEHERRSIALEHSVSLQRAEFDTRIRPIETHVALVTKIIAFIGTITVIVLAQYIIRSFF